MTAYVRFLFSHDNWGRNQRHILL